MSIDRLVPGDRMDGFYLLQSAAPRTTANGRPFLTVTLADRTGSIDGQVWDYAGPLGPQHTGQAVKVRGSVGEYRGARQVTVERIRLAFQSDGYTKIALAICTVGIALFGIVSCIYEWIAAGTI